MAVDDGLRVIPASHHAGKLGTSIPLYTDTPPMSHAAPRYAEPSTNHGQHQRFLSSPKVVARCLPLSAFYSAISENRDLDSSKPTEQNNRMNGEDERILGANTLWPFLAIPNPILSAMRLVNTPSPSPPSQAMTLIPSRPMRWIFSPTLESEEASVRKLILLS